MGKRNQARKAAQANKARRVAKRAAPAPAPKPAPAPSRGGGGGGGRAQAPSAPAPKRSAGPQTANQMRKRVQRQEAAGKDTSNAQRRLDAVQAQRKQERNKSYGSQGEVSGVSDFDFSKKGKDTVEKGELNHLKKQGFSREEIAKHVNESGMKIRKGAQAKLDNWAARAKAKEKAAVVKKDPIKTTVVEEKTKVENPSLNANTNEEPNTVPVYKPITVDPAEELLTITGDGAGNNTAVNQSQDQTVSQDNDINSTVTGDNNNVNISQDNSVRQYGGINKSFVYNGSSNGKNYMDTPVSAATMGGFYHDEDTPGRSAAFVDRYTTMNSDYQKRFQNTNFAQSAITKGRQNKAVDIDAIDQRVNDRAKLSRARSSSMAGDIFGDMYNYKPEEFTPAKYEDKDEDE